MVDRPVVRSVPSVPDDGRVRLEPRRQVPLGRRLKRVAGRVRRTLFSDKVAAANVVMFMITAAIFLPAIALMFLYLQDAGENQETPTASLHTRAQQALILMTSSPGRTESGKTAWHTLGEPRTGSSDELVEVGILVDGGRRLSFDKIRMIQQGNMELAEDNGFLDYPEFKQVLNIGDRHDLRVRSHPIITSNLGNQYGSDPIKGKHVGYVAALTDESIDLVSGAFAAPTDVAKAEIRALELLQLTTDPSSQTNGFDSTWYQPCCTSLHNLGGNPLSPNNYVGAATVQGDIIATSARDYYVSDPLDTKAYLDWFFDSYFKVDADTYRFDALVFGSDVDYTLWNTATARQHLRAFLDDGHAIVLLGLDTSAEGLVHKCGAVADCLLGNGGGHDPFTTPDVTNPILSAPNKLQTGAYVKDPSGPWPVCDDDRKGFIPVVMDTTGAEPGCTSVQRTYLGLTAGDRYTNGGTLVLGAYDVTEGDIANSPDGAVYIANLLNIATLRAAYMDFGPALPDQAPVEGAERVLVLEMPDGNILDLSITLYMWRTG